MVNLLEKKQQQGGMMMMFFYSRRYRPLLLSLLVVVFCIHLSAVLAFGFGQLFGPPTTTTTTTTTIILFVAPRRRPPSFLITAANNKNNKNKNENNKSPTTTTTTTTTTLFSSSTIIENSNSKKPANTTSSSSSKQSSPTTSSTTSQSSQSQSQSQSQWFPTRIQETLVDSYSQTVSRLYLRQVVTETREVANLAMKHYSSLLTNSSTEDPFGDVANTYSTIMAPSNDGGTIGWVDVITSTGGGRSDGVDDDMTNTDAQQELIPYPVLQQLYDRKPKAGDMFVLESPTTQQYHLIQVAEIWLARNNIIKPFSIIGMGEGSSTNTSATTTSAPTGVGSFTGHNVVQPRRSKLKGKGILPEFPTLARYSIQTSGCQMNVADSERLAGILENDLQLEQSTENPLQQADLVLWNTCSIRDRAEQKLYNAVGPYAAMKRSGKRRLALIVTGCVAQQEGLRLLKRIPELDAVIGPQYVPFLKSIVESIAQGNQLVATSPMMLQEDNVNNNIDDDSIVGGTTTDGSHINVNNNNFGYNNNKPIRGHDVRAWVNVIYGCNEHCTYCVVPSTRGMEQSRSMEAVLSECLSLAGQGYREVTLIGQNIDAYGRDMKPRRTFADLLEFLNQRLPSNNFRIRYVTSHPRYFSERVIDAVASLDKVCECFHMPFQAGDDEVLRKMRRGYTYDSYMNIIHKIREIAPDAAITADVIVGFPYETDEAFEKTLQLMEEVKFDNINSFCYSPRPNTEAALWDDHQIPEEVKSERLHRVQELATKHALERSQRYLGRIEEVLVEDPNPRNPSQQVMGRTRQGRQVYFNGDLDTLKGRLVNVLITEARTWSLMGELVEIVD